MSIKTFFINSSLATYNEDEFAWFQSLMLTEGVIGDPTTGVLGLAVTQNGTPDMSVLVSAGKALVELTKSGRTFKVVIVNDASEQVIVPANSSGSNRVDAIIVRVDKDAEPNALKTNITTLELVQGSGVSALSDGAITTAVGSDGWYRLANVTVASGDTAIINAEISDTRAKVAFTDGMSFDAEFISSSAGAADAGKVPVLDSEGKLDKSFFKAPVKKTYTQTSLSTGFGTSTTQFDITNPSGSTFRYTWDTTGTDPNINATTFPIGKEIKIAAQNFDPANNGGFVVTGSGANYFEVSNPSGVVESNRTLGTGSLHYGYIKPAGLKQLLVRVQGGGASSSSTSSGGGGGYCEKLYEASELADVELLYVGAMGSPAGASGFAAMVASGGTRPRGGSATGGDINVAGMNGINSGSGGTGGNYGIGGNSHLGRAAADNEPAEGYGAGAAGANGGAANTAGVQGVIYITEIY